MIFDFPIQYWDDLAIELSDEAVEILLKEGNHGNWMFRFSIVPCSLDPD